MIARGSLLGRPGALVLAAVLAWLAIYHHTAVQMAEIWSRSGTFTHGFVVPPIAAWLAWRSGRWRSLADWRLPAWGFIALAGFGALWLAGRMLNVAAGEHLGATGILVALLWIALGADNARRFAFPLGFLFFAPPVGDFLVPELMEHTATFTVHALRLSGVPVYREGLQFVVPNGNWSVVEACSGVRYLIASLMVGTLFAYLTYQRLAKRLVFVGVAMVVPIVANWVRAYLIVLIGYLSGNRLAVGVDHLIYGWVFFGLVVLAMFWVGGIWRDPDPLDENPLPGRGSPPRPVAPADPRALLAAVVLALLPMLVAGRLMPADRPVEATVSLPGAADGWTPSETPAGSYRPEFKGYRGEAHSAYLGDDGALDLWAMVYANQTDGHELVNWENQLVPGGSESKIWSLLEQGSTELSGRRVGFARVRGPGGEFEVYHWYRVDGHETASDIEAKLRIGWQMLSGRGDACVRVVLAARVDDRSTTRERAARFVGTYRERLAEVLEKAVGSVQ